MEIAIDISPISSGHKLRGTGSYTRLLVDALQKYEKNHSYHFFTRGQIEPKNVDLIHYPYFDPFFLTLPVIKSKPTVVTVHDLIPIVFPDHFSRGLRGEIKWQIQKFSLLQTREIITDSMASKADIVDKIRVSEDKVHVVYLAPDDIYKPVKSVSKLAELGKKYYLPKEFALYVGDVNWNKNIPTLIEAVKLSGPSLPLVVVGNAIRNKMLPEVAEIDQAIHKLKMEKRVIKVGFVPDADLPAIYSLARVYIQVSRAEGFGLPVLEAMACGCPVVSSSTTSLKEISGPAVLVDPEKPDKIAQGINIALMLDRNEWFKKASNWLTNFSLRNMADQTVEVYRKALS